MVVKTKAYLSGIMLIFLISIVSAQPYLNTSKLEDVYFLGHKLSLNVTIFNKYDHNIHATLETSMTNEDDNFPLAIIPLALDLESQEKKTVQIYNLLINEDIPSSLYTIHLRLLFDGIEVTQRNLEFEVITVQDFSFNLKLPKKVFVVGENINITYASSIENPSVDANLRYPDGKTEKINLPRTIKPEQTGTYTLEVQVEKEGYKTAVIKEQFGVIKESPEIEYIDFEEEKKEESKGNQLIWVYATLVAVAIMIISIILFKIHKK